MALKLLGITGVSDTNGSRSDAIYMFGDTVDDVRASTELVLLLWESDCQSTAGRTHFSMCWCRCCTRRWHGRVECISEKRCGHGGNIVGDQTEWQAIINTLYAKAGHGQGDKLMAGVYKPKNLRSSFGYSNRCREKQERALLKYAVRFGDLPSSTTPYVLQKDAMKEAYDRISDDTRSLLDRSAERVRSFAQGQKDSLKDFHMSIQGGKAGHTTRSEVCGVLCAWR